MKEAMLDNHLDNTHFKW